MNEATIREIGIACLNMNLTENTKAKLEQALNEDISKRVPDSKTTTQLTEELEKETIHNFQTNKIIIASGWVLSITEARQCALFSLTQ
jgi:predicted transcriptional regulator YheO